jgi:hypothetical protein
MFDLKLVQNDFFYQTGGSIRTKQMLHPAVSLLYLWCVSQKQIFFKEFIFNPNLLHIKAIYETMSCYYFTL